RILLERRVQAVDVRLMILPTVNLHRLRVDVRLERAAVVGQWRKGVCHGISSSVCGSWMTKENRSTFASSADGTEPARAAGGGSSAQAGPWLPAACCLLPAASCLLHESTVT